MKVRRFTKVDEEFVCENCGNNVLQSQEGSCRNHCNKCLFSKHLDVNPGDRASRCGGLMEPVDFEMKERKMRVLHRCLNCGFERWNKLASDDDWFGIYEEFQKSK